MSEQTNVRNGTLRVTKRFALRETAFFSCSLFFILLLGAVPLAQEGPSRDEAFRMELLDYFTRIDENSPTVFKKLAADPEALASIQDAVLNLSPEQLREMWEKFTLAPHWQLAPEVLLSSLSPDFQKAVLANNVGAGERPEQLKAFQTTLASLSVMTELASPDLLNISESIPRC